MRTANTKYGRVMQELSAQIERGEYTPGSRLPGQLVLTKEFDVSVITVNRALNELAKAGVLERRERSGTYVAEQAPPLSSLLIVFDSTPQGMVRVAESLGAIRERAESLDIPTEMVKPDDPALAERLAKPEEGLGMVVLEIEWPEPVEQALAAEIPLVVAGREARRARYCVTGDRRRGGYDLTRALIDAGCARIGCIGNLGGHASRVIHQGYQEALLPSREIPELTRQANQNTIADVTRTLLEEEPELDGLLVTGGGMLFGALPVLLEQESRPRFAAVSENATGDQLRDHAYIARFQKTDVGHMAVDMLCEIAAGNFPHSATWYTPLEISAPPG